MTYAGVRPATEFSDYQIDCTRMGPTGAGDGGQRGGWMTVAGIRSTGLTASLGIANHCLRAYLRATALGLDSATDPADPSLSGAVDALSPNSGNCLPVETAPRAVVAPPLECSRTAVTSPLFTELCAQIAAKGRAAAGGVGAAAPNAHATPRVTVTLPVPVTAVGLNATVKGAGAGAKPTATMTFAVTHPLFRWGLAHASSAAELDPFAYPHPNARGNAVSAAVGALHGPEERLTSRL
jgi:hypothetical protein